MAAVAVVALAVAVAVAVKVAVAVAVAEAVGVREAVALGVVVGSGDEIPRTSQWPHNISARAPCTIRSVPVNPNAKRYARRFLIDKPRALPKCRNLRQEVARDITDHK